MVLVSNFPQRERFATAGLFAIEQQHGEGSLQQQIYTQTNQPALYNYGPLGYQHSSSHHHHHRRHHEMLCHAHCLAYHKHSRAQITSTKTGTLSFREDKASSVLLYPEQLSRTLHGLFQSQTALSAAEYLRLLRACTNCKSIYHAKQISAHLVFQNIPLDGLLGDYLVVTLATCGAIDDALSILHTLKRGTVYSWTAIISGYVKCGNGHEALKIFNRMQEVGVEPNGATFVSLFQASGSILDLEKGKKLHVDAHDRGLLCNQFVGNCLVSMYIKCGAMQKAEDVFMELPHRDVVSWNTMLSAFADQGQATRALRLYRQMQEEGKEPDHLTITSTLQACSSLAETQKGCGCATQTMPLEIGLALHAEARRRLWAAHVVTGTALIILYGSCGLVSFAEGVFWASPHRNTIVWNSMFAAYLELGLGEKALESYAIMRKECPALDEVTCMYVLQACGESGSLVICNQIHFAIVYAGCDHVHFTAATLIQAYRNCASMLDAQAFFHALPSPDFVTWTTCIAGHAGDGNFLTSLHMFEHFQFTDIEPDEILFTAVLSACGHVGLVIEGLEYFESLRVHHGKNPHFKHYGIMLDLLGRAGNFKKINAIMNQMPIQPDLSIWLSLLGACHTHGNVELAKHAFDHVICMKPDQTLAYILMANIYINAGLQNCAADIEIARHKEGGDMRLIHNLIDDELCTYL